ncbi:site-specific integrase [uncultured Rothia sp.]|uniref:tyrosine-type recombinase/integrase n=1 Tax=uncultured Rothia sp. TaxID=316088 RepID=UPI00321688ED
MSLNGSTICPLQSKSKKNVHSILSAGLKTAIADGYIDENVAAGLRVPQGERKFEPVFLSEQQMNIIYAALPHTWVLFVKFLENTGLRFSEATALRWRDISFDGERGIVRVSRAWKRSSIGEVIGPPKTQKSIRSVSLPLWLTREIKESRGSALADDLVFCSARGAQLTNSHFHRDVWIPLMKEVSEELQVKPRVHDLRHTHASNLIAKGVPLPVIQARLGHESITTTVNTYGHLSHDADALAASLLD